MGRSTDLSPLGALVAEIREEQRRKRSPAGRGAAPREPRAARAPDLRLETRVVSERPLNRGQATLRLLPLSFVLHTGLLLAVIVVPLLTADLLPTPSAATTVFFVQPGVIAPPPPPPPPPAAAAAPRPRPDPPTPSNPVLTAPLQAPDQVVPEQAADLGVPGGEPGGVPGGVIGGIVGGLPAAPPPTEPLRVGGDIKEPRKLKHVDPVYPDIAVRANIQGSIVLECTVSPQGRVTAVKVLRGIPLLNAAAVEAVKQWVYTPTLWNGVPVPIIMTVTVEFRLVERRR